MGLESDRTLPTAESDRIPVSGLVGRSQSDYSGKIEVSDIYSNPVIWQEIAQSIQADEAFADSLQSPLSFPVAGEAESVTR